MVNSLETNTNNQYVALHEAADQAYQALAARGWSPEEVHRIAICDVAANQMVDRLVERGFSARHEARTGEIGAHSYVTITSGSDSEIIADPTWQQFLPHHKRTNDLPKMLVGTRGAVIEQARHFGVPKQVFPIWETGGVPATHRPGKWDRQAEEQEDMQAWLASAKQTRRNR